MGTDIEAVDGAGGFDNVAAKLPPQEGLGGLEWDVSPNYHQSTGNAPNARRARHSHYHDEASLSNPKVNSWAKISRFHEGYKIKLFAPRHGVPHHRGSRDSNHCF